MAGLKTSLQTNRDLAYKAKCPINVCVMPRAGECANLRHRAQLMRTWDTGHLIQVSITIKNETSSGWFSIALRIAVINTCTIRYRIVENVGDGAMIINSRKCSSQPQLDITSSYSLPRLSTAERILGASEATSSLKVITN